MNNFTDTPCDNIMPEYVKKAADIGYNKESIEDMGAALNEFHKLCEGQSIANQNNMPTARDIAKSKTNELLTDLNSAMEDFQLVCDGYPAHRPNNMKNMIETLLNFKIKEIQKDLDSME